MKPIWRDMFYTIHSFTICKLIIDLLTVPTNFITNMHPAFKAVFAFVVYLFGSIPLKYAAKSVRYWLGFHKGLQLSTPSQFCENLRFQAHYNRHYVTYIKELQHIWCLGEREGIQSRPLFLYSLERAQYHAMQFLFTIILIGVLVLLARHRSDRPTAPITSVVREGVDPAIKSTSVKHAVVNVSGSGRGSSRFGVSGESFDSTKQEKAETFDTASKMRYGSTRKLHKQKPQQCEVGHRQKDAKIKQHERVEPKRASPQRLKVEAPLITMTSQPSPKEQALRQGIHELGNHAKDALTSSESHLQVNLEAGKELLQKEIIKKTDLEATVSKLERTVENLKAEIAQAIKCNAGLASKVATHQQQAQVYIQSIAMLQTQLHESNSTIRDKETQISIAESGIMAMLQEKANYQEERGQMVTYCANLAAEHRERKDRWEDLEKEFTEHFEFELAAARREFELFEDASRREEDKLKAELEELEKKHCEQLVGFEQDHCARFEEYTAIKSKAQNDIKLLGQESNLRIELERQLQQERATSNDLRKKLRQSQNTEDRMDETGDNTWVQKALEAELVLNTRNLRIKALEHQVMVLERENSGRTLEPLPQPRAMQPLRTTNVARTPAAPTSSSIASNATPSGARKGLDFAHLDETRVRKEVSSYIQTALESVTRWNKACYAGSVGAEKVVKNFATMLANWEYLQEDMIQDEKLLRAVKNVVGLEGKWTTAPTPVEIMGGKEPARDRMVKVAKRVLARIEGTGEEEGSKGVKRTR